MNATEIVIAGVPANPDQYQRCKYEAAIILVDHRLGHFEYRIQWQSGMTLWASPNSSLTCTISSPETGSLVDCSEMTPGELAAAAPFS